MNAWQIKALMEWYKMLQGSAKGELLSQYGHLLPEEADTGVPSTMELAQRARRETALAGREGAYSESPLETTGTLQSGLEALDIPSIPGKEIAVIPRAEKQARVYEYKNVPNIRVDPSGEAKIISDLSASIKRYREMKTGMKPEVTSFDPAEQARRLAGAEQAAPPTAGPWHEVAGYPPPQTTGYMTETQKRAAHLRKALADLKRRRKRHQGRTGLPFNPKIWDRNMLPTGGPIQRQLDRRKY